MKINLSVILLFFLSACNQQHSASSLPKGELAFLLQYHNRLPSDVGFMTNHIMERRISNLLKQYYEPFMNETKQENPIEVDSVRSIITVRFTKAQKSNRLVELVMVDVANDAVWVDYYMPHTVLHFADRVSLERPDITSNGQSGVSAVNHD